MSSLFFKHVKYFENLDFDHLYNSAKITKIHFFKLTLKSMFIWSKPKVQKEKFEKLFLLSNFEMATLNGWWFCNYGLLSQNTKNKVKTYGTFEMFFGLQTCLSHTKSITCVRNQPFLSIGGFPRLIFQFFVPFFRSGCFGDWALKRARIHR